MLQLKLVHISIIISFHVWCVLIQNHYVSASLQPLEGLTDFYLLSEIRDASSLFLSDRILTLVGKHSDILDSIHVSDQYTGFVQERCVIEQQCLAWIKICYLHLYILCSIISSEDSDVVVVKKAQKRLRITYKGTCNISWPSSLHITLQTICLIGVDYHCVCVCVCVCVCITDICSHAVRSLDESDRYLKFALQLLDHLKVVRLNKEVSRRNHNNNYYHT